MLNKIKGLLTNDQEFSEENQRLASIVFLALAGIMSFFEYTHVRWFWDYHLTFVPTLKSAAIAVLMIAPLYLRGVLIWNRSIYSIVSLILILLVFASFIELAMGGNGGNNLVSAALGAAVLLSWLGIKEVARVCWILALGAGLYSAVLNNQAMGFYGFIYVACGFLGLIFHSRLNPGQLVAGIRSAY